MNDFLYLKISDSPKVIRACILDRTINSELYSNKHSRSFSRMSSEERTMRVIELLCAA